MMTSPRSPLPLALASFATIVGLGMVVPVLPFQVTELGGDKGTAPLIFAAFSAAAFLGAPLWGLISDRLGRKPVLLASALLTGVAYMWLAYADSLFDLYGSRIFAGLMAGWMAAATAYIADVTTEGDRAKGMGLIGAAFGAGFTIGPGMGAFLVSGDNPDYAIPALAATICSGVGLLIAAIFVVEPDRRDPSAVERITTNVFRLPKVPKLLALHFAIHLVFTATEGVFAVWAAAKFGLGAEGVGYFLAFAGLVTVIVQGGVVRRVVPILGEARVIILAAALLTLTMLAILGVSEPWMILIPMGLLAAGMGLHNPAMQSWISQVVPAESRGGAMGTVHGAQSLARVFGPAWGAAAFTAFGPDAPFLIGAVILLGAVGGAMVLARGFAPTAARQTGSAD
jgi:DHA1 family tetracycline resistance protein-like MFS transporter